MSSETFGDALRTLRLAKGLSQRELARRVGMDYSYVSGPERGHHPTCSPAKVLDLASTLGGDADELLRLQGRISQDLIDYLLASPDRIAALRQAATPQPEREPKDDTPELSYEAWVEQTFVNPTSRIPVE